MARAICFSLESETSPGSGAVSCAASAASRTVQPDWRKEFMTNEETGLFKFR